MKNKNPDIHLKKEIYFIEDLFNEKNLGAKPFLKWAGGKSQLLKSFKILYPKALKEKKIKNYYEPFLGSGAVYFDVIQQYSIENAYLYDVNEELIITYKVIQKEVHELINELYQYEKKYMELNHLERENYYLTERKKYNSERFNINFEKYNHQWIRRAAQLIFLNKTCFNGLYRVNSKGEFNSPVGKYENPKICNERNLIAVHHVLQHAIIQNADYKKLLNDLKTESFIYFDPPYRPISKTANFKSYSKHQFNDNEQIELADLFKKINQQEVYLMLSNSDPKNLNPLDNFFDELYKDFNITRIAAKRMINANAKKRGAINEIIVTNY